MAVIVVAEDNNDIRAVVVRILQRAGHTLVEATDGAAGLLAVGKHTPDLVVSDIDMPIMSGIDLCRAIRDNPTTTGMPVLFISGSLTPGDDRPAHAQATAILRKPFSRTELLASVDKLLQTGGHRPGQEPTVCP